MSRWLIVLLLASGMAAADEWFTVEPTDRPITIAAGGVGADQRDEVGLGDLGGVGEHPLRCLAARLALEAGQPVGVRQRTDSSARWDRCHHPERMP